MKKLFLVALVMLVTACNTLQGDTALQRYYGLQSDYQRALLTAVAYKTNCEVRLPADPCHENVKTIQDAAAQVQTALDNAEALRSQGNSGEFSLAVTVAVTALTQLETYLVNQSTTEVQ